VPGQTHTHTHTHTYIHTYTLLRNVHVNRFDRLGWKTERKVTPLILLCGERGEERREEETGEERWRGEMKRRGKGLRCESAHTGYFIEGDKL